MRIKGLDIWNICDESMETPKIDSLLLRKKYLLYWKSTNYELIYNLLISKHLYKKTNF